MADWTTISSLATAGGTLVLAVATFSSVRSANRAARAAERSLLAGLRPLLMPARLQDPPEKVSFIDGHRVSVAGGYGTIEVAEGAIYLAFTLRNAGNGIAVLHGWYFYPEQLTGSVEHAPVGNFRRLTRDIYVPAGSTGFWQGAFRDRNQAGFAEAEKAAAAKGVVTVDLLYGDHEGGQRMISRFSMTPLEDGPYLLAGSHHWYLDRPPPR